MPSLQGPQETSGLLGSLPELQELSSQLHSLLVVSEKPAACTCLQVPPSTVPPNPFSRYPHAGHSSWSGSAGSVLGQEHLQVDTKQKTLHLTPHIAALTPGLCQPHSPVLQTKPDFSLTPFHPGDPLTHSLQSQ